MSITYVYKFSEDGGRTWRTIGYVSAESRACIEAKPLTNKRFRRSFVVAPDQTITPTHEG